MCKVCSLDAGSLQVVGIVLKVQSFGQRVRFATSYGRVKSFVLWPDEVRRKREGWGWLF